jgi:hypothetical protein
MRLADIERRFVVTIAETLLPAQPLSASTGIVIEHVDVAARYDEELADSPFLPALFMHVALWLVWLAPLFVDGKLATFGGLDGGARVDLFERMLKHRAYAIRMTALFIKLSLCTMLLADVETMVALGAYDTRRLLGAKVAR